MKAVTVGEYSDEWNLSIREGATKRNWLAGNRDHATLMAGFALGWIEPHVTWASDLGWRVTDAGKKAGLK